MQYTTRVVNEDIGDGLFAQRKIRKSSNIIKTEFLIACLDKNDIKTTCYSCHASYIKLKRCSLCKHVYYCSEKCQRKHWKIHKHECPFLQKVSGVEFIPLLIRLTALFMVSPDLASSYHINDLMEHESLQVHESDQYYGYVMKGVIEMLTPDKFDPHTCYKIYCKLIVNLFTLEDSQLRPIGCVLIPAVTKMNHSCSPNCVLSFKDATAYVTAIKDIDKGEQLTISYIPLPQAFLDRKAQLLKQFNFKCECEFCSLQRKQGVDSMLMRQCMSCTEHSHPAILESPDELVCSVYRNPFTSSPILTDVALKNMEVYDLNMTSVSHQDVIVVNHLMDQTDKLILEEKWDSALRTGLKATIGLMEWCVNHPSAGLFIAKLAKLYKIDEDTDGVTYEDNLKKSMQLLDISLRFLTTSLPPVHGLISEVKNLYDATAVELQMMKKS